MGRPRRTTWAWLPRRWRWGAVGGRVVTTVWATLRRSSALVSSAVWFCIPPMGSNPTPFPTRAEAGGSNTEHSLSTLIRVRSPLLIPQRPPKNPSPRSARGCRSMLLPSCCSTCRARNKPPPSLPRTPGGAARQRLPPSPPFGEWGRDAQGRQHHLLAPPDRPAAERSLTRIPPFPSLSAPLMRCYPVLRLLVRSFQPRR